MASITKIAVLDDYQNVALPHFRTLPSPPFEVTIFRDTLLPYNHPSTPFHVQSQLVDRLKPFQIICTMRERTPFPKALLENLPNLKLLLTTGPGNAAIDRNAAKELRIPVAGTSYPSISDPTTQQAVALILGIANNIATDDFSVKNGGWQTGFSTSLAGKTLGIVGLGRLGISVSKILHQAFGMKVIAWSSKLSQEVADEKARKLGLDVTDAKGEKTFRVVTKEELFKEADVVSVHYVLSERSRGIVGKEELELMKKTAFLVNTSRGPLIKEADLLEVLKAGKIKGVALDVFDLEPLPLDSEWRTTKWGVEGRSAVLLTPHVGYVERDIIDGWYKENVGNIQRWHEGKELLVQIA